MWQLVRLNFGRNNAHFGELGIGMEETSERVYSDTLFSAWVSSYARLFGAEDVAQLLAKFPSGENQDDPPFRVSSTFIYSKKGESEYIYYVPKPLAYPQGYPVGDDLKFTKTYKKLKYLPLEIWRRWYQEKDFTDKDKQELIAYTNKDKKDKDKKDLEDSGTFSYGDTHKFYSVPKVAIDRNTHAANIYHTGFVQYQWESNQKSGLYFLIKLSDEDKETESKLKASLRLLGEEGMGGERSNGAGRFEAEFLDLPPLWSNVINFKSTHHALISLFWANLTLESAPSSYSLLERGGWITSSGKQLRRKNIRMFGEGSIFKDIPQGQLADVTPDQFKAYRVYRSGISLSLPIIIQNPEL